MVNWHDPSLLLDDYGAPPVVASSKYRPDTHLIVALIKLNHALAGIFMSVYTQTPESAH